MKAVAGLARVAAFGLMTMVIVAAASDEKFGKGVSLTETTSIKALYGAPETFVGKTIRVDGVVTAVCQEMGCWMALGESDKAANTIRLKVDHDSGIVFPIAAKGKAASAEGVFEKIAAGDKEGNEAAAEQGAEGFGKKYQLKATGAVVK